MTRIARDSGHFSFLADCAPDAAIVHGDARISLERGGGGPFDLLVLDAFSSDVVPIHLITREALALYMRNLTDDGILLMHISNRNLNLRPAVAAVIADARLAARVQRYTPPDTHLGLEATGTEWVVAAREASTLEFLDGDAAWLTLRAAPESRPWTDDYSDIFGVLRW